MLRLFLLLALLVFLLLYWSAAAQTVVSLSSSGEVEQQQRRTKRRLLALAHHHDVILAIPTGKEGGGCGGVLIAPDVILAVTNCEAEWLNADGARILQSHHHRHHRATATAESTKTIRQVNFMFKHPQYDPSLSRTRHNLMLIQLTEPVVLLEEAGLVSYYYDEFADNAVTENEIMKLPLKPSSSDDHNEGTTSPALYLLLADSTEADDEDPVVFARLVETIEPGENEPEVGEKAPQQNRETQQTEQVGNYDNQQQHMFCTKVVTKESGYFQGGVHGGGWPIVTATSTIAKIAEDSEVDHRQIQHHSTSRHRLVGLVSRWNNPPEDAEATTATTAHCVTDSVHIAAYSNWIRETLCCVSAHLADNKECHDFKQRQQNGNDVSCSATIMQQREQQRRRRLQEDTSQPSASPVEGNTLNPSTERTATPLASSVAEQPSATPVNTELTSAFPLPGAGNEPTSSPAPNGGTNNVPTANPNNFTADGPSFNPVGGGATSVPVPPPTRPPFLGGFFPESPTVHPAGQTASPTENASTLSPSASPVQGAPPTAAPRDPPTRPPFSVSMLGLRSNVFCVGSVTSNDETVLNFDRLCYYRAESSQYQNQARLLRFRLARLLLLLIQQRVDPQRINQLMVVVQQGSSNRNRLVALRPRQNLVRRSPLPLAQQWLRLLRSQFLQPHFGLLFSTGHSNLPLRRHLRFLPHRVPQIPIPLYPSALQRRRRPPAPPLILEKPSSLLLVRALRRPRFSGRYPARSATRRWPANGLQSSLDTNCTLRRMEIASKSVNG